MPPHVLHCWSYGQGRWRGHHWQWPRARLHQYQHLNPCSGCPRCSDAMTPTCRRRPSAPCIEPTECAFQPGACIHGPFSNAGRQWVGALSKSTICNENVPMTRATSPPWTLFGIMTRVEPCVDQRPSASLRASIDDAVCADVFPPAHQCGRWRGHWHNKIP